jgi:hypothetical protein
MNPCNCFYCHTERVHPSSHQDYEEMSPVLLKAESLEPADMIRMEFCMICGHVRPIKEEG